MAKQPREADRIQCLICKRWMRALPRHIRHAHDLDVDDYRLQFGIPVGVPLVCLDWSDNQSRKNIERGAEETLTAKGPPPGYRQRESVRANRRSHYDQLAKAGTEAAAERDKTAERRAKLSPYPVTVDQAMERLGCTRKAAYTFLSYCVQTGRLKRVGRGLYGDAEQETS